MRSRFLSLCLVLTAWAVFASPAFTADPPQEILFDTGVEYSNPDNQHLAMNIARPKSATGLRPAILCIHGGGFRAGKREGYDGLCKQLAERGYVAATTSYRLAPKYQFPEAIHDVKAAVRYLRANAATLQIDPDKIGVVGGSAGGHLAQFLGVTGSVAQFEGDGGNPGVSSQVSCVVNFYGPSDFTKSYGKSVDAAEVLPLWLGGDLKTALHKHQLGSPLNWVTPEATPTLLIHGTEDPYVAFEQAEWMHARYQQVGAEVELLKLEGAGHGFKGADADRANAAMFEFFDRHF
jgi:acetyl esterase/lipase